MKIVKNLAFITIVSLPLYVIRCKDFLWCVSPIPFTLLEVLILITFSVWVVWITHSIRKKEESPLELFGRLRCLEGLLYRRLSFIFSSFRCVSQRKNLPLGY